MSTGEERAGPPYHSCSFFFPKEDGPALCSTHHQGATGCAKFFYRQLYLACTAEGFLAIDVAKLKKDMEATTHVADERLSQLTQMQERIDGLQVRYDLALKRANEAEESSADWKRKYEGQVAMNEVVTQERCDQERLTIQVNREVERLKVIALTGNQELTDALNRGDQLERDLEKMKLALASHHGQQKCICVTFDFCVECTCWMSLNTGPNGECEKCGGIRRKKE